MEELHDEARDVVGASVQRLGRDLRMAELHDTVDRRRASRAALELAVNDSEGIEAKMLTDVSNALPAEAAVTGGNYPRARKTRGTDGPARELGTER